MTTQPTSSSRTPSDFLKVSPKTQKELGFFATEKTLELLHKYVSWETVEDLGKARQLYEECAWRKKACKLYGEYTWQKDGNFDIGKELDVLKALHSAMMKEYDVIMKQVEDVEIGDDADEDKEFKQGELYLEISSIRDICSPVNRCVRILESAIEEEDQLQEGAASLFLTEDSSLFFTEDYTVEKKRKRNLESPEVEKCLLDLLMELGGKTSIDKISTREFSDRWECIVNDFKTLVG